MPLKKRRRDTGTGFCSEIPNAFCSLEQSRNSLDYQWNSCVRLHKTIETSIRYPKMSEYKDYGPLDPLKPVESIQHDISSIFERWLVAFQNFLQNRGSSLDSQGLQASRSLRLSHSLAILYLKVGTVRGAHDETVWDRFTEYFEEIIRLIASIVDGSTSERLTPKEGFDYSMDMSTIASLYVVAHRCRHPIVRRKAVSLLHQLHCQEGVWNSVTTAHVAERLISIEESGLGNVTCCEDVPDWARISDLHVKFDPQQRHATVTYSRQRGPSETIRETVTDSVWW